MVLGNWRQKVDTDNYENPFASTEKEIGQMDVQIDEEDVLRESIRTIILEVNDFQCNTHSLGWISPDGEFIDLENHGTHDDWMIGHILRNKLQDRIPLDSSPPGWIKVSTANELWLTGKDWSEMTFAQFEAMVEMWSQCKRYSRWLQIDAENFYVTFGTKDPTSGGFGHEHMDQYTIPEFIDKYVGRRGEDLFYGMLLGEM